MDEQRKKEVPALFVGFGLIMIVIGYFAWKNLAIPEAAPAAISVSEQEVRLPTIPVEAAAKKFFSADKTAVFLDIRSADAFAQVHIPRSVSIPADHLSQYSPKPEAESIIVWAAADKQSMKSVMDILDRKGAPYAFIDGGIEGWVNAGGQAITIGNRTSFIDQSKVTLVSLEEWKALLENTDAPSVAIDVRSRAAFAKSHIKNSINIPLAELETSSSEIPRGKNIALIGETDAETFQAAVRLFDLNIFVAKALDGSFNDWVTKGYQVEAGK